MGVTLHQLLRTAIPMAGILVLGGIIAWVFGDLAAIVGLRPLRVVTEPLAELTKQLALALAVVYGVQQTR